MTLKESIHLDSNDIYALVFSKSMREEIRQFIQATNQERVRSQGFTSEVSDAQLLFLYIRVMENVNCYNVIGQPSLVIAKIEINPSMRGQGLFKKILDHLESINPYVALSVEAVYNTRLKDFLMRRGYYEVSPDLDSRPTVFKFF